MSTPEQTKPAEPTAKAPEEELQMVLSKDSAGGTFSTPERFKFAQRVAQMLITSPLVPERFRGQGALGSAVLAVDMAQRLGMSPLMIMQQIYEVHGKFGWSAQFVLAGINGSRKYESLRYDRRERGTITSGTTKLNNVEVVAWTTDRGVKLPEGVNTLEAAKAKGVPVLEGPPVNMEMAVKEGWYGKSGSKWQTMPEVMLRYRAATFFGRLYCPELSLGLPTVEEIEDTSIPVPTTVRPLFALKPAQDAPKEVSATVTVSAAEPLPEAKPEAATVSDSRIGQITEAATKAGVTMPEVLQFLTDMGVVTQLPKSVEDLPEETLTMLSEQAGDIVARIVEAKGGKK